MTKKAKKNPVGRPPKKKPVGRPRKYSLKEAHNKRLSYAEKYRKVVKNVSLDQECIDMLHNAADIINSKLPDEIKGQVKLRHKDVLKIALREYTEGSRGEKR